MSRKLEQYRWPGGEHDFRLGYGEIEILQEKCDAGPEFIMIALAQRTYKQAYPFEILRLGLIGGGMDGVTARAKINNLREEYPLRNFVIPALEVLNASLNGVDGDQVGEQSGGDQNPITPEENGNSAVSTASEHQ